ncbi:MAG: hypothetical protein EBR82_70015, partial [Caulobacteraceae bacterium]|nr:hypothetical protein [Caulobacteraceae bacterium]
ERIANVVRAAELASPAARPLSFEPLIQTKPKVFRVCTFTGAWAIGDTKTVTFKNQTTTPNTVTAINLFLPVPAPGATTDCAIARDGTSWVLIDVPFETATAVFVSSASTGIRVLSTQSTSVLTDVTLSASLNTSNCTISIGKTLVTASSIFVTGTSTGVFVQSTFTSTFLRFRA